jgi:septal ring factor EnvC (AmiA/AmiB activator)
VNEVSELSTGVTGSDLNLKALMDRIREQAARQRAAADEALDKHSAADPGFNWPQVQACLNSAARLAPVPTTVPTLGRFRGLTRLLARLALRGFLALARVITVRQGDLNARLIEALRETAEGLRNLEMQVVRQNQRIQRLEAQLWREEARKT